MDGRAKSNGETITQHTQYLLDGLEQLFRLYGNQFSNNEKELIYLAATYHDYGKNNYSFQKRIYNDGNFVPENGVSSKELDKLYGNYLRDKYFPHGYLSPAFLDIKKLETMFNDEDIKVLINAIVYHHTRDCDFIGSEVKSFIREDLQKRTEQKLNYSYLTKVWGKDGAVITISDPMWVKFAIVKGILNKADYWASSDKEEEIEIEPLSDNKNIGQIVEDVFASNNLQLRDLQVYMKEHCDENVVLIASTGSGKTEGALLWAQGSKLFYTLPLRVSINAIYQRIVKEYAYGIDKLALLHSDAFAYLSQHEEDAQVKTRLAKAFSYPITICTVDQLFRFIYKYRGSEILLAVLKYSKLVIDEIQAYSPEMIGRLIYGLKLITMAGGRFAIMTATLPPVVLHFLKKEQIIDSDYEPQKFVNDMQRHWVSYVNGDFDYDFIRELSKTKKVLIICNTVKKAQDVYEKLNDDASTSLLHSRFTGSDRRVLEKAIMDFSKDEGACGVWISTQIVEASLDIDFDILLTEMCTADSLLQRMGRCYRKRTYTLQEANVYVYDTRNGVDEGRGGIYNSFLYDGSVNSLKKYLDKIFNEKEKIEYIDAVYDTEELKQGRSSLYTSIENEIEILNQTFPAVWDKKQAQEKFRNIQTEQVIPECIFNQMVNDGVWDSIYDNLKNGVKVQENLALLRDYTIPIKLYKTNNYRQYTFLNQTIYIVPFGYDFNLENTKGKGLELEIGNIENSF